MYDRLKTILESRGWSVQRGDKKELIQVQRGSDLQCVDGRKDQNAPKEVWYGPKLQGAAAGVAVMLARMEGANAVTNEHVERACDMVAKLGFTPSLHDVSTAHLHCGRLVKSQQLGDPRWDVNPDDVAGIVHAHGGHNVNLDGSHQEKFVGINFVPDTTRVPNPQLQSFQLDAWFATALGLDLEMVLTDAAATVEALNGPKIARIWE